MTIFRLSPLIQITLLSLYLALTLPLPFLAQVTQAAISPWLLTIGLVGGFITLAAVLSERVIVDENKIQVTYPRWIAVFWRKGWSLTWKEIKALKMRTTGQGGLVYYFVNQDEQAYLLPMRIAGFNRLVNIITEKTGLDTSDIRPLAQPWMYFILLGLTGLLLLIDAWTITTAISQ